MNAYAIETKNLSIFYGQFEAVKDVNLQIEPEKSPPSLGLLAVENPRCCAPSTA